MRRRPPESTSEGQAARGLSVMAVCAAAGRVPEPGGATPLTPSPASAYHSRPCESDRTRRPRRGDFCPVRWSGSVQVPVGLNRDSGPFQPHARPGTRTGCRRSAPGPRSTGPAQCAARRPGSPPGSSNRSAASIDGVPASGFPGIRSRPFPQAAGGALAVPPAWEGWFPVRSPCDHPLLPPPEGGCTAFLQLFMLRSVPWSFPSRSSFTGPAPPARAAGTGGASGHRAVVRDQPGSVLQLFDGSPPGLPESAGVAVQGQVVTGPAQGFDFEQGQVHSDGDTAYTEGVSGPARPSWARE